MGFWKNIADWKMDLVITSDEPKQYIDNRKIIINRTEPIKIENIERKRLSKKETKLIESKVIKLGS